MRLIDADATIERMKGMNMLFSPKIVIDCMPTIDTEKIRADAIDEFMEKVNDRLSEESFTRDIVDVNKVPVNCDLLTLDGATEIVCEVFEQMTKEKK